jgi:predicted nucleic acid-binding protein
MADTTVLVDTNVAIDWLNSRRPWVDEASPLWASRDAGKIALYLPASVLTDILNHLPPSPN